MVDMVRRDVDDGEDVGVDACAADISVAVGDEVAAAAALEVIRSGSRRTPPELMRKWTLPNVRSIPSHRSEKAKRDTSA
jgi:hypothetical protein